MFAPVFYRSTMIKPLRRGEDLAREIKAAKAAGGPDAFDVWWLGQSGFLIQWNKTCLLFDPYLSDSLTKKYAQTNRPHVRMSELAVQPHLLNMIDIVTSSHNHTDHLDADTLQPLLQVNPGIQFVIPEANRTFVCDRIGCAPDYPLTLKDGHELRVGNWNFVGVPAAHNTIERNEAGACLFMGFVVKFGRFSVYHSGDTLWYTGMTDILKPFQVDVAFLPINGNVPERGVAGNLNAAEAAELGKQIGARCVVPHHYDMFAFNSADPAEFVRCCQVFQTPYRVLQIGERHSLRPHYDTDNGNGENTDALRVSDK